MTLSPGTRLGPYEILAPLGSGGMGEVYRARDPRIGRDVAVKVLPAGVSGDEERQRRFEQEVRAAGGLSHPNVVTIFDVGLHEGCLYVVSELLEGETLRLRVADGPLPWRKAIDYTIQAAHGLAAAHDKGIVHRDLKPENLFLTRDGRVKILDFGLAKLIESTPDSTVESGPAALSQGPTAALSPLPTPGSEPGRVLGTVGYMSPEQVRGQLVDQRSDIFSLGTILYEMLTGRRAFHGESAADSMSAILREEPPELSRVGIGANPALEHVVRHCLEKRPEERFQSVRDLAFHLQALLGVSGLSSAGVVALVAKRRPVLRPALLTGGALVLLVATFLLGSRFRKVPSPVFRQLTFGRGAILTARFAPDGETIVYSAAWGKEPFRLFSTRREGPESRSLGIEKASLLAISPSGEMALSLDNHFRGGFQFSGTLARAPLSGGTPREILEGVYEADWARDGAALVVVRSLAGRDRLEWREVNVAGGQTFGDSARVLFETAGWISHPRVSPAGDRIAFLHHPHWPDESGSLEVVDVKGNRQTLSSGWFGAQGLAWSPKGEIWLSASRSGKARSLYGVSLSGRERLLAHAPGRLTLHDVARDGRALVTRDSVRFETAGLAPGQAHERDLSWLDGSMSAYLSPDGSTMLFFEGGEAGSAEYGAYLRKTDGSAAVRLGDGLPTALSPDGKWALTLRRSSQSQIVLLPTGPGEARRIPHEPIREVLWAHWLPDGENILINGAEEGRAVRSYVQGLQGGVPRAVTPEGLWARSVSPDGQRLVVSAPGQPLSIVAVRGGEVRPLPGSRAGERPALWSADGRFLYVFRRDELPCKVERLAISTGERELWKEFLPPDPSGVIAVHEVHITPDTRSYVYSYVRVLSELYLVDGLD